MAYDVDVGGKSYHVEGASSQGDAYQAAQDYSNNTYLTDISMAAAGSQPKMGAAEAAAGMKAWVKFVIAAALSLLSFAGIMGFAEDVAGELLNDGLNKHYTFFIILMVAVPIVLTFVPWIKLVKLCVLLPLTLFSVAGGYGLYHYQIAKKGTWYPPSVIKPFRISDEKRAKIMEDRAATLAQAAAESPFKVGDIVFVKTNRAYYGGKITLIRPKGRADVEIGKIIGQHNKTTKYDVKFTTFDKLIDTREAVLVSLDNVAAFFRKYRIVPIVSHNAKEVQIKNGDKNVTIPMEEFIFGKKKQKEK